MVFTLYTSSNMIQWKLHVFGPRILMFRISIQTRDSNFLASSFPLISRMPFNSFSSITMWAMELVSVFDFFRA
ncbi:hypothetical protein NC651_022911 [Populus alba x Populus x berolinensis]|nr:hypothetical protein NC651_022911 [Populus alba x Populus x berolinensis]